MTFFTDFFLDYVRISNIFIILANKKKKKEFTRNIFLSIQTTSDTDVMWPRRSSSLILNTSEMFLQNGLLQKNQALGDPPQIYLTSVSDPGSLTSLIQVAGNDCVVSSQQGHPVFVVIKPSSVGEAKEANLPSGEDLLDIVDLDVKPEAEVRIEAASLTCPWFNRSH